LEHDIAWRRAKKRPDPSGPRPCDASGRPLRILIAEDEPLVAETLRDMIAAAGGENVGVISTALATIGAAGVAYPDVVLMDIRLSGDMDGIDAAGIIRAHRATPVVFITGAALDADMRTRLAALGDVELVFKPIEPGELCMAILRAYKGASSRRLGAAPNATSRRSPNSIIGRAPARLRNRIKSLRNLTRTRAPVKHRVRS